LKILARSSGSILSGFALSRSATPGDTPSDADLSAVPPRHMAVFVAAWKEHRVIRKMIYSNVTRLN